MARWNFFSTRPFLLISHSSGNCGSLNKTGVRLFADLTLATPLPAAVDTFLVADAPVLETFLRDEKLKDGILTWSHHAKRFGSVCSGALLLAAAGLLDNRRVTTHWSVAAKLSEEYPRVNVEADAIFIAEGELRTAAGVTSGLDLALNMSQYQKQYSR